jgi:Mn2+/Fe2+ NRAMP family transporter
VFAIKPDWLEIGKAIITPSFQLNGPFLVTMLAVIGTTITPWGIYYLQASIADKGVDMKEYKYTRIDVGFGAAWGNIISAFILIVTAATLYVAGIAVTDAKEAAQALQPLAGNASTILFSIGLLGASLLAVSVLPLSTTYAFCEAYGFERGLNRKVKEAPVFYGLLIVIMVIGSLVVLIPGAPLFTMMILSQTVNAILLPIVLVLVLKIANNKQVMGKYTNSKLTNIFAILITVMIVLVTIALFFEPLLNKIV